MELLMVAGFAVLGFVLGFFVLGPIVVATKERYDDEAP